MKKFINEFKEFALRGNVLNLAVGVIIGAAFQGIIRSLTDDILSPIIGLITRGNLDSLSIKVLNTDIRYGAFITAVINFFIMAIAVFVIIKIMARILTPKKKQDDSPKPATKICPFCKTEIALDASRCPACTSELL